MNLTGWILLLKWEEPSAVGKMTTLTKSENVSTKVSHGTMDSDVDFRFWLKSAPCGFEFTVDRREMRFLMAISVILSLSISHTDGAGGGQFIGAWKKEEGNYYSEIFRDILSYFEIVLRWCSKQTYHQVPRQGLAQQLVSTVCPHEDRHGMHWRKLCE